MSSVSIIVISYNHAKYLPKCLKSIFAQTRKADEIFVIDDFSQDNTQQVIKNYLGKVRYIRHQKNFGPVKTYNDGLRRASGDFLLLVPGDDWLAPKLIEKEALILETNREVCMVYAQNFMIIDGQKRLIVHKPAGKKSYIGRKNDFELLLTQGDFIPFMTAMVRKSIYENLGLWDEKLPYLHDYEMWIRIAKRYPLAYLAEPLAYYRIHSFNLSRSWNFKIGFEKDFKYILKKHLPKDIYPSFWRNKAYYYNFITLTSIRFSDNKIGEALNFWVKAIKSSPASILTVSSWAPFYFYLKNKVS